MKLCPEMARLDRRDLQGRWVNLETQGLQGLRGLLVHLQQLRQRQRQHPLQQDFQWGHLGLREVPGHVDPTDRRAHPGLHRVKLGLRASGPMDLGRGAA